MSANLSSTVVRVDFDMDGEIGVPQRRMQEAFERILACRSRWTVLHNQPIDQVRARSDAGTMVGRRPAAMGRDADPLVETTDAPLAIEVQGGAAMAYFYSGFVLVARKDSSDLALVDLADFDVMGGSTRFHETDGVPADAHLVGISWANSKKDGYSRVLVAQYGDLQLRGPGGLHESFMVSRVEPCKAFAAAVLDVKRILASGQDAQEGKRTKCDTEHSMTPASNRGLSELSILRAYDHNTPSCFQFERTMHQATVQTLLHL